MAVTQAYRDGRYAWRCEDCSRPRLEMARRGPRKSVCKACQNKRYRRLRGDALRERNRYRMRLRRTVPGRPGQVGTIAGPEQRCYPFRARPGPAEGRGLVHRQPASARRSNRTLEHLAACGHSGPWRKHGSPNPPWRVD